LDAAQKFIGTEKSVTGIETKLADPELVGEAAQKIQVALGGWPYRTVEIPEDGPVVLDDTPPRTPPSFGVMKAQSERAVRDGLPGRALVIRPGYIVGPGDTSDRFTYWPVRMARGGEVLVPGRRDDRGTSTCATWRRGWYA
jgi:2'-hydroxyisoflavone reductase